jgi:hypothetical protein
MTKYASMLAFLLASLLRLHWQQSTLVAACPRKSVQPFEVLGYLVNLM